MALAQEDGGSLCSVLPTPGTSERAGVKLTNVGAVTLCNSILQCRDSIKKAEFNEKPQCRVTDDEVVTLLLRDKSHGGFDQTFWFAPFTLRQIDA